MAYDAISDVPKALASANASPWRSWLTTAAEQDDTSVRACGGACPQRLGSAVGEDPNRKPRFYVVSAQKKDLASSDATTAAWATVQTIYVY